MEPKVFLSAEWRHLAMLNYTVEPALLAPLVPSGTELDTWNGRHYVSMVGFMFLNTRVRGIPIPFHRNFEEVNLRFYVRSRGPEGWRRGVVFVKEIVPRFAIAAIARWVYNENYVAFPMANQRELDPTGTISEGGMVEYRWRSNGRWNTLSARTKGAPMPLGPGSEAEFIAEHYWGYAAQRDGGCVEYQVEHPPWRAWEVDQAVLDCDALALYGGGFAEALAQPPVSAFVAEGSPIVVRAGTRITGR